MSFMHIMGGILIGLLVGKLFSIFSLRKVKGGKYSFMAVGAIGSLLSDLVFKFLYEHGLVSNFFYRETTIVMEI